MFLSMVDFFFSLNSSSSFEQPRRIFKLLIEFSHSVVPGRIENKTVKNVLLLILINTIMMGGREARERKFTVENFFMQLKNIPGLIVKIIIIFIFVRP